MNPPELTVDGAEMELFENDDPLSDSSVKAKLAWDDRDAEYVMVWWQKPFYIATENGGYSMSASLLEKVPDNIQKFWVVDTQNNEVLAYERDFYDDPDIRQEVSPDDERFKNITPELQYAVDTTMALEVHDFNNVELP
jgi:hypothetical protein